MCAALNRLLSKSQLAVLINLNLFLNDELTKPDSVVSQYVSAVITRVVITNVGSEEKKTWQQLLAQDQQTAACDWILARAPIYQDRIFDELNLYFTQMKSKLSQQAA